MPLALPPWLTKFTQALSLLYQGEWVSPGSISHPITITYDGTYIYTQYVAGGSDQYSIQKWEQDGTKLLTSPSGYSGPLVFDGTYIVAALQTGTYNATVYWLDPATLTPVYTLNAATSSVNAIYVNGLTYNGLYLYASIGPAGAEALIIIDPKQHSVVKTIPGLSLPANSASLKYAVSWAFPS